MNIKFKELLKNMLISIVTLIAGFVIVGISFNLFKDLTDNEMKLLFAIDILALIFTGAVFMIHSESKKAKREKEAEFQKRHNRRVKEKENQIIKFLMNDSNNDFQSQNELKKVI